MLPDGLWQVTTDYLCAGFVIEDGRIVICAPILRRNTHRWFRIAVRISD